MPWIEYKSGGTAARDLAARTRAVRTFKVWGTTKEAILSNPTGVTKSATDPTTLPPYNATHPQFTNIRLEAYDATPDGSLFIVNASYALGGIFTFQTRIRSGSPGFYSWSLSSERVVKDLPFVERGKQFFPVAGTVGVYNIVQPWILKKRPVLHRFARAVLRVSLPTFGPGQRKAIDKQLDTLHQLPDGDGDYSLWLLEGGDVTQTEGDPPGWSVEYTWVRDPGTIEFTRRDGTPAGYPPNLWPPLIGGGTYVRPPFEEVVYVPHPSGNPETLGTWNVERAYRVEYDGYLTLPGVT